MELDIKWKDDGTLIVTDKMNNQCVVQTCITDIESMINNVSSLIKELYNLNGSNILHLVEKGSSTPSKFMVEWRDDGEVYIDGKYASQLCWNTEAVGWAVTHWLNGKTNEEHD